MGRPGGAIKMSPLQMCMEGLKAVEEGGAKLDCLSMSKKLKVRHTRIDGPNGPKLEIRRQRRCRSGGKLGRCRRVSVNRDGCNPQLGGHLEGV